MEFPNKSENPQTAPQKKVLAPIVPPGAMKVKRPATRRFLDFVFAESPKVIARNVANNVLMPRLKEGTLQALNSFASGMLYGNGAPPQNVMTGSLLRNGGLNYQAISNTPSGLQQAMAANQSRPTVKYQDVRFNNQQHAEVVLANLFNLLKQFNQVAIGDLNDMLGISSEISDNAYGWTTLNGATISQDKNGWLLELPPSKLL